MLTHCSLKVTIGEDSVDVGNVDLKEIADTFPQKKFKCINNKQMHCAGTGGRNSPVHKKYSVVGSSGGSNCWYDGLPIAYPRIAKGDLNAAYEASWGSRLDLKDQFLSAVRTTIEDIAHRTAYMISTDCFICRTRGLCGSVACSNRWDNTGCACGGNDVIFPWETLQCKAKGVGHVLPASIAIEIFPAETLPVKNGIQQLPEIAGIALGASLLFKLDRTDIPKGDNFCKTIQLDKWGGLVAPIAAFAGPLEALGATAAVTVVKFICLTSATTR